MAAGRPLSFNPDKALDRAMHVFWRNGYERTSVAALTRAMRINPPSLYAAFGNKKALFEKALARYAAGPGCYVSKALGARTARAVVEQLLDGVIRLQTAKGHPGGCLIVRSALAAGDAAAPTRKIAASYLAATEGVIRKRLERAKAEGDLPPDANPRDLARYVFAVICGVAVAGATGAGRRQLQTIAQLALRAWPS